MPLPNFGVVGKFNNKTLYRSAQPDSRGFEDLKTMGVSHIIKLNKGDDDEYAKTLGIEVYEHPLQAFFRFNDADEVISICRDIMARMLESTGDSLIHCTLGRDRTGLVCGAMSILYLGYTVEEVNVDRAAFGVKGLDVFVDYSDVKALQIIYDRLQIVNPPKQDKD